MGFFAPSPKVTPDEWKKVRARLLGRGLSQRDVDDVEAVVSQALRETGSGRGIDKREVKEIIAYLKRDRGSHDLSDEQIERVEDALEDKL